MDCIIEASAVVVNIADVNVEPLAIISEQR
jgi:hypothetical protein